MGKLNLVDIQSMDEQTQDRFKKIIRLGNIIREGMAKKKINIEQARKQSTAVIAETIKKATIWTSPENPSISAIKAV